MKYGIPYMGSKNTIAEQIVKALPRCDRFLDACCGGGAIMQCAAMSGRFKSVVANDINPAVIKLLDAIFINKGQIDYEHPTPCTRVDFFNSLQRIENGDFTIQDCVNKYCASFGNDGKTYLWNGELEKVKVNIEQMLCTPNLKARRLYFRKFISFLMDEKEFDLSKLENIQQLQNLERMQRLERLQRLQRLERLENCSIFDIDYSQYDMVYFDIPYKGTAKYDFKFDHDRFYEFFASLNIPAFLSEYNAPFDYVATFDKRALFCAESRKEGKKENLEKLYFNGTLDEYKALMGAEYQPINKNLQTNLF